ncbi:MAG TPA: hypothetical protein VFJ82_04800 [Longimicrobium sp.]|nr:hypothetical protein [Longimicrobium sp.]
MSPEKDPHADPCAGDPTGRPGCVFAPLERLRFWNGRFLVARDLRHQQDDLVRRVEYHQRFAHGEGILCGYSVRRHPRRECVDEWLVVEPGMAYDCCGRTLWMPEPRAVRIPGYERPAEAPAPEPYPGGGEEGGQGGYEPPRPANGYGGDAYGAEEYARDAGADPGFRPGPGPEPDEPGRRPDPEWFVVACRVDRPTDPQPALYADDLSEPVRHEHGRLREEVEVRVLPASRVSEACWPRRRPVTVDDCDGDADEGDCRDAVGDTVPCGQGCACGECVVLAGVWRDTAGRLHWDTTHRRVLSPPTALTHITGINWPHGGEITLRQLTERERGRLVVRFSRRLQPADGFRRGINPMTFSVEFLGQSGAWEQVMVPEDADEGERTPTLSANGRCAVFAIPRPLLTGRHSLAGSWVRVRLLGDFILDCHGRAVSAAHIGGDAGGRGSGNGVPGGTFESWFYVRDTWQEDRR